MNLTSMEEVIDWLDSLKLSLSTDEISGPGFLKPFHLVTLALILKKKNIREKFAGLTLPEDLSGYAERMGLWEAAGMSPPQRIFSRHSTDNCMPISPLDRKEQVIDKTKEFEILFDIKNNQDKKDILIVLSELLENCYAHGRITDELHGFVCAQQWQRGDLGQIAICDLGIGIRSSLNENINLHSQLAENNACVIACEYGVTSKPRVEQHHSGYGLTLTKDILKGNGGRLIVVSYDEFAWLRNSNNGIVNNMDGGVMPSKWPGTLIVFEWKISQPLDALSVYNSWPQSDEDTGDDSFI